MSSSGASSSSATSSSHSKSQDTIVPLKSYCAETKQYLNPMTLSAHIFHDNFLRCKDQYNEIDGKLFTALINIVNTVNEFLKREPAEVYETENYLHLLGEETMAKVSCYYGCNICSEFFPDIEQMTFHLVETNHNGIKSKKFARQVRQKPNFKTVKQTRKERKALKKENGKKTAPNKEKQDALEVVAVTEEQTAAGTGDADKEKKGNKKQKQKTPFILPRKIRSHLNYNYDAFFKDALGEADSLLESETYGTIEGDLIDLLTPAFPDQKLRIYKFGSRLCGIGTRSSDLDIFLAIDDSFNVFENHGSEETVGSINKIKKSLTLRTTQRVFIVKRAVTKARVPIIKAVHVPTGIQCDIGISNSLGYCNTELQKFFFHLQPIARQLAVYMKKWLSRSKLSNVITTYSSNLMIFYYLQTKSALPSVETLQANIVQKSCVGPWIYNFNHMTLSDLSLSPISTDMQTFKTYLKEFFEFLVTFKYHMYIMSPYYGRPINLNTALMDMPDHYLEYVCDKDLDHTLAIEKPMVIQDPIQLNHNVTKNVPKATLIKFKEFLNGSAKLIELNVTNPN